jgi:hypothetical protein
MPAVLKNMQIYFVNFQIEDYSLVKFLPLDMSEEESINDLLLQIDNGSNNKLDNRRIYLQIL